MPKLVEILLNVNEIVNDFKVMKPKKKYSEPKIYTGGVDVSKWNKLSKSAQQNALKKHWCVYFSFRNPETGKLERQDNIKGGANYYRTKKERLEILETYRRNLSMLLQKGFNPYDNDSEEKHETMPVKEAFEFALKIKKQTLAENSYTRYKSRINRFLEYLDSKGYSKRFMTSVDKKLVMTYLNSVLESSSPRNRNNTRVDLSSVFQVMEDNNIIPQNFVSKISVLKAPPKRNKTYSEKQLNTIYDYLKLNDPNLLLFIKFVSYNFLRPIEVCRIKVGDINIEERIVSLKAKNKLVKRKIIPDILIKEIPDLSDYNLGDYLFTPNGEPGLWEATENNRRDYFTKRYKKVKTLFSEKAKTSKDYFVMDKDYTIYSFRHTFITKLYREFRKNAAPFEAKSKLMLITGHSTMTALENYLRDIDAELPEDYSAFIK